MHLWIVFISLLLPPHNDVGAAGVSKEPPVRYRGIEQLLAKFEAEAR